jgi:hypothetical protein
VTQTGGSIVNSNAITLLSQTGGLWSQLTGDITTHQGDAGTLYWTDGNIGTSTLVTGTLDGSGSQTPRNNPPNRTRYVKPRYTTTPRVKVKPYVTPVEDIPKSPTTPKVKTPRTPLSLLLPHLPKWITPLIPFILAPERMGDPKLDPFNPNIPGKYLKKVEKPNIDRVLVKPKSKK